MCCTKKCLTTITNYRLNLKEGLILGLRIPSPKGADYCNGFPDRNIELWGQERRKCEGGGGRGGEGVLNKVLCGKAPVQSLTLYFFNTTFDLKGTPFVNLLLTSEWYPFHANSRAHSTLAASSHT